MSAPYKHARITEQEMVMLYQSGLAAHTIAVRAGLGTKTVRQRLVAAGVQMRPKGTRSRPEDGWTDEKLAALYATGKSAHAIALEAGLGVKAVLLRLHSQGVVIRPHTAPYGPRRIVQADCCACCGILLKFSGDSLHKAACVDGLCLDCAERWVRDGESWRPREDYVLDLAPVRVGCDVRVAMWPGWRMVEEE